MASFTRDWNIQYKKTDNPIETRTVGIEFECTVNNKDSIFNESNIMKARENWVSQDISHMPYDFDVRKWIEKQMKEQKIKFPIAAWGRDGGDKEFVTEPDSISFFNGGGSKRFKEVMAYLDKNTLADQRSGTHIHIGFIPSDDVFRIRENLYWFMMAFGEQVQKIFGRRSHWAKVPQFKGCGLMDSNLINEVEYPKPKSISEDTITGCHPKGFIYVKRDHTIEFRGPKASHDIKEVLAWVQFCFNMVEICSKESIIDVPFAAAIKGTHIQRYLKTLEKSKERQITLAEKRQRISRMTTFKYYYDVQDKILK